MPRSSCFTHSVSQAGVGEQASQRLCDPLHVLQRMYKSTTSVVDDLTRRPNVRCNNNDTRSCCLD